MRTLRFILPALALALVPAPAARAGGGPVEVVASGLDSPRHLEFGSGGDLFVAEAGRGGSGPCFVGGEGPACMGATGAVTKIDRRGHQSRIATGLASYANTTPPNTNAIGPHGIAVLGRDIVLVTNGGPTEPKETASGPTISRDALAQENPVADLFGRVLLIAPHVRRPISLADMWRFERDANPDAEAGNPAIDSNPVDVERDGLRLIVADAGGNSLNAVNLFGRISNLAVFANGPAVPNPLGPGTLSPQSVPTSVEVGRDGHYYVGQLTGFPFPPGAANVYRVSRRGGTPQVFASGFTNIMDLAFGPDGTLYVLEIDHDSLLGPGTEGAIFAISRRGQRRQIALPPGTLPMPGGITVAKGALYVTINSGSPGGGKVLRIRAR